MSDHLTSLFERFRERNDLRALAKLFDEVAPELASVAAHMAKSSDEAEDLVQATFLSAIERSSTFDASRPVVPWLLGIQALHARKQRERAGREIDLGRLHQPAESDPEFDAQRREISSAVGCAVEKLSPNYAPLVRRFLIDGATPALLAREFELSPITARVRLHRGLKPMRKLLPFGLSLAAFGAAAWRVDLAAIRARVLERASQITGAAVPAASLASGAWVFALLAPVALALPTWLFWPTTEDSHDALTNLPLADKRIAWRTGPDFSAQSDDSDALVHASAVCDAQGKLSLRLPLGPARFVALPSGTFTPSTVDWSAGNVPIVLRFSTGQ